MIYLDHNATTPIAPEVREAMLPYLTDEWGNPSSSYRFGSKLKGIVEQAREQVAELLGASPREVLFTSCATESYNAAVHAALKAQSQKRQIVTSVVEHSSVLNYCRALESEARHTLNRPPGAVSPVGGESRHEGAGVRVSYLPVDRDGLISLADLETVITGQTAVVSLLWANNETGVLFPINEIAQTCQARGVLVHCDGVQAVGRVPVNVRKLPVDYLSVTGLKFHAPKGIGALYIRGNAPFSPLIHGGHQERNLRGGTESVPLIVGLGRAAELARKHPGDYDAKVHPLRDALERGTLRSDASTELNGHPRQRLCNTTKITFHGIESEALLLLLDQEGVCASSGSACPAHSDEPSHVVKATKPDSTASRQMIRFSLGPENTPAEIQTAVQAVRRSVEALRL